MSGSGTPHTQRGAAAAVSSDGDDSDGQGDKHNNEKWRKRRALLRLRAKLCRHNVYVNWKSYSCAAFVLAFQGGITYSYYTRNMATFPPLEAIGVLDDRPVAKFRKSARSQAGTGAVLHSTTHPTCSWLPNFTQSRVSTCPNSPCSYAMDRPCSSMFALDYIPLFRKLPSWEQVEEAWPAS